MRIAREEIDPEADKVVRRLARHGYKAYLVGGCVRDLLLGRKPKDFDVATSATPNDIRQLFRNCRIIGRRFRLAHIFFGGKIIETSTFRANPRQGEDGEDSDEILIRRDNVFGNELEDAQRRDFTMNGLFYDVEADHVIDHVGGLADVEAHLVSTIGDPDIRFREDPVRILRAIKFAARLDFAIEPRTLAAAIRHRGEIAKCAPPRVLEEVYRLLRGGAARRSIELLCETGAASVLSPQLAHLYCRADFDLEALDAVALDAAGPLGASVGEIAIAADDEFEDRAIDDGDTDDTDVRARASAAPALEPIVDLDDGWSEPAWTAAPAAPTPTDPEELAWAAVWADEAPLPDRPRADDGGHRVRTRARLAPARREPTSPRPRAPVELVGDRAELEVQRAFALRALDQLDVLAAQGIETSNALLLAALASPFVLDALLAPGLRPIEINDVAESMLGPLIAQLQIARKDADRARQIVLVQRRLTAARRGGKPGGGGARRDVVDDAQLLSDLLAAARGEAPADGEAPYWTRARAGSEGGDEDGDGDAGGKRRRRRRGGRRRRRGGDEDDGGADRGLDAGGAHEGGDDGAAAAAGDGVESIVV